jgi:hypothetical protein
MQTMVVVCSVHLRGFGLHACLIAAIGMTRDKAMATRANKHRSHGSEGDLSTLAAGARATA